MLNIFYAFVKFKNILFNYPIKKTNIISTHLIFLDNPSLIFKISKDYISLFFAI